MSSLKCGRSPILIFAYSRPRHLERLLDSLAANEEAGESTLYIYCDGAKKAASTSVIEQIMETRRIANRESRFAKIIVKESAENKGLANAIISGVTEVINMHSRVIVLEDDLVVSPFFLAYMNDSLDRYEHSPRVGQIGACNMFACGERYPSSFFIPIPDCLGWATWKDRWSNFNPDAADLLKQLHKKRLIHKFNAYGSYDMERMLKEQVDGRGTSWAVRWTAVCVLNDWLTIYPNPALTNHIESDEATNANINITPPLRHHRSVFTNIEIKEMPIVIRAMKRGYAGTGDYYGNLKEGHIVKKFKRAAVLLVVRPAGAVIKWLRSVAGKR